MKKNNKGSNIGGTYNRRDNGKWNSTASDLSRLYALIRKRAVNKNTLKQFDNAFTQYAIFVLPVRGVKQRSWKSYNSKRVERPVEEDYCSLLL